MADNIGLTKFSKEEIPDEDLLYLRVHREHIKDHEVAFIAFKDQEEEGQRPGLSVNWNRYATAQETRSQGRQEPDKYGVVQLIAGDVRAIPGLTVEHNPWDHNRAHSEIYGNKRDQEVRVLLRRACEWVIRVAA